MGELDKYQKPSVAVDVVVFTIAKDELKVLLVKRDENPFKNLWTLPGGFVRIDETLESAALRSLEKKTGVKNIYLEQLYTFADPKRDPRGRVISVNYFVLIDYTKLVSISEEEGIKTKWFSVNSLPELGFDHKEGIEYALKRLRYKLEYTSVGLELLPDKFTLAQLQKMYETILDESLDKRNFRKKIESMKIVEETKEFREGQHRPAKLYKFKKSSPKSNFKKVKFEG